MRRCGDWCREREHRDGGIPHWRRLAVGVLVLMLGACAAPRLRPDGKPARRKGATRTLLAAQPAWSLSGSLAISDPDGGRGALEWSQDGNDFSFEVNAPVTGKTWTLTGNDGHVELTGLRAGTIVGDDAATLLERELGWKIPVSQLAAWVRATRVPGKSGLVFRADGLPAELVQDGWKIEYHEYLLDRQPAMPRRIFAGNGDYTVRLVVQDWHTP